MGNATVIHAKRARKQKTDRQDAQLILRLMLTHDFPQSWADPNDCRADARDRAGSGEMSGSAAVKNPPWGRATDRPGLRTDYREGRSVSVWQADRELSGTGTVGRFEREPATTRTYHETRQHTVAFPAGGSSASDGAQPPGMAQPVCPPDDEAGTENRQGRHGAETGSSLVLDDAQGMGFRKVNKVRFARGKARNRRWCEVKHRVIDWVSRSPCTGEFEVVIMIEVVTEEMHGSD